MVYVSIFYSRGGGGVKIRQSQTDTYLQTALHLDAQRLQLGERTMRAVLGVATCRVRLLERGLQLADLASETRVLQVQLVQLAVRVRERFLRLMQVV